MFRFDHRIRWIALLSLAVIVSLAAGCGGEKEEGTAETAQTAETQAGDAGTAEADRSQEPDYIVVQHILVGFEGSVPGKQITRTQGEAGTLATQLFERAQGGEDFDALVKEFTDDAHPGIYKMANTGLEANMQDRVFPRDGMVPAFGDVGFPLGVGEVGIAEYNATTSPYGWHIIKRIE